MEQLWLCISLSVKFSDLFFIREPLWSIGKDFTVVKLLPSGVYHYRFIVDERLRYTPDSPFELDDSGNGYNVLDVQVNVTDF